jgi:DNA-binding MarR family transcriptional regulator
MESAEVDALRLAIIRLSRKLRKSADRAGVTPSQTSVLFSLDRRGPLRLGDLARCEQVANPTITRLIAALEAKSLVERSSDESDARSSIIAITSEGRELLATLAEGSNDYLRERLSALPRHDVSRIVDAIGALTTLADG